MRILRDPSCLDGIALSGNYMSLVFDNEITGFDYGLVLYQCESGCAGGVFTSLSANDNSFVGNTTAGQQTDVVGKQADS